VDFFEAQILTQGVWPQYPDPIDLPVQVEVFRAQEVPSHLRVLSWIFICSLTVIFVDLQSFKEFYLSKHTGRKLVWQHSLGHCIVKAIFPKVRDFCFSLLELHFFSRYVLFMTFSVETRVDFVGISSVRHSAVQSNGLPLLRSHQAFLKFTYDTFSCLSPLILCFI
jgi:hypothetical protein